MISLLMIFFFLYFILNGSKFLEDMALLDSSFQLDVIILIAGEAISYLLG